MQYQFVTAPVRYQVRIGWYWLVLAGPAEREREDVVDDRRRVGGGGTVVEEEEKRRMKRSQWKNRENKKQDTTTVSFSKHEKGISTSTRQ